MNRGFFLLAGIAGILFLSPAAVAGKDIKAELAEKKAAHAKLLEKSKALGSEVDGLKSKLINASQDIRKTEQNIAFSDRRLEKLRAEKEECIAKLYSDRQALGGLLTAAQRFNRTSMSQLFLQSKPLDAARASLIIRTGIPVLHEHANGLQSRLNRIAEIEKNISEQKEIQSKEYNKINKQEKDLAALLKQRQRLYKQTESARKQQEEEVTRLAREAKSLEDLVLKIKPKAKTAVAAALPAGILAPVQGPVRTGFGERDDLGASSKGITFATREGATVVTPLSGTVKFAGPFQKYKQILIVEHPGGYHSLIAGLGRIDTVVGASLSRGEPVGSAAQSVYYELRQNGDPVNPQKLLVAQRKQGKS